MSPCYVFNAGQGMMTHFGHWLYKLAIKNRGHIRGTLTWNFINAGRKPEGMSQAEIDEVMRIQEVTFLPRIYREFLEAMGKGSVPVFQGGESGSYHTLRFIKANCMAGFTDDGPTAHDFRSTFVFLEHQYHTFFLFFTDDRSEDPEVFMYHDSGEMCDGRGGFCKEGLRLREFFLSDVRPIDWKDGAYNPSDAEVL